MFVTNWISTTKIQKISEITNFFRHYFLSRTEVVTDDRYMSRQHLAIQVIKASTNKVRVVVSNYHNKNASYVNGQLLNEGDQLVLTEGSIIKMGNTTVVYHQK